MKTIPISLEQDDILKLDKMAESELSSRNRILRIAIREFLERENARK